MTREITFNCANYVARRVGYSVPDAEMVANWMRADAATQEYFEPIETFRERFTETLDAVAEAGFTAVDVWPAQLHASWATEQHVNIARETFDALGLRAVSIGGRFGETSEQFDAHCVLARELGVRYLCGSTTLLESDPEHVRAGLEANGLVLGIENHPADRTPADILAKIPADMNGTVGTTVDTGWWGTQGYDAAQAIEELAGHVLYVHLKDVLAAGAHETCRFGDGVVPVERCLDALDRIGYAGPLSIEHEPGDRDPMPDVLYSRAKLEEWLAP